MSDLRTDGLPTGTELPGLDRTELEGLLDELMALRADLIASAERSAGRLAEVHPAFRESARNLLHYLALRRRDLRPLQRRLAVLGLSSLGRAEPHVLATVDAVLHVLHRLLDRPWHRPDETAGDGFARGHQLLEAHTADLLGPARPGRNVRIMVTLPSEAADDGTLVGDLLAHGMDAMRINCAHDDAAAWTRMIAHLQQAEPAHERACRVVMDLAGPKLRTGPVGPGLAVLRIRPRRDDHGHVTAPARVWLTDAASPLPPPGPADATLPVPGAWRAALRPGDRVAFTDARDAKRRLTIVEATDGGSWAEATKTAYVVPGLALRRDGNPREGRIGDLPAPEAPLVLQRGDRLVLTRDRQPGRPAVREADGRTVAPARIGCTLPAVLDDVRAGESIWFDDGKIGGVFEHVGPDAALVRITHARPGGRTLQGGKGINLPESALRLAALTEKDIEDLPFVARHADVVELSFANTVEDVERLQEVLAARGSPLPAIVLKVETRRGFEALPAMLLAAMRAPCCGVMIARGDLAVECGFERLAEVQEEILWVCEAAHVPVIWATQVLETLAKTGVPSRAEITDAAMGHRAECVMLNKGPHVVEAVQALDDILRRMQTHQSKKSAMLRALHLAGPPAPDFFPARHGTLAGASGGPDRADGPAGAEPQSSRS